MMFFLLALLFLLLPKLVVLLGFLGRFKAPPLLGEEHLPGVSVLIPARNEAHNLPQCLDSLLELDYPLHKLEIIVGDDQSKDQTASVIANYASRHSHIRKISIAEDYHNLVARSNALAQLVKASEGEYVVFLDADMQVAPGWLRYMVAPARQGFDLISGCTEVRSGNLLSGFQQIDWLNVIMLLKAGADMGLPGTALGNNMIVSRSAYHAVGGYEAIGPTYTEDNDLTLALRKSGCRLFQLVTNQCAFTKPMDNYRDLYRQRNRWMRGAFKQPLVRLIPLIIGRIFVLWSLLLSVWDIEWGLIFMLTIAVVESVLSFTMAGKTKTSLSFFTTLAAPVFNSLLDTFTLLSAPWNSKVVWKERKL